MDGARGSVSSSAAGNRAVSTFIDYECGEHSYAGVCGTRAFHFLGSTPRSVAAESYGNCLIFEELLNFKQIPHHFTFPSAMYEFLFLHILSKTFF